MASASASSATSVAVSATSRRATGSDRPMPGRSGHSTRMPRARAGSSVYSLPSLLEGEPWNRKRGRPSGSPWAATATRRPSASGTIMSIGSPRPSDGLTFHPARQQRDGARVVAQPVASPIDDPQFGRTVRRVSQGAGIRERDDVVVRTVHDQQRPIRQIADDIEGAYLAELAEPGLEARGIVGVPYDTDVAAGGEESLPVGGPVVEGRGRRQRRHAADAGVGRGRADGEGAARTRARQPDAAHRRVRRELVDGGDDVVTPPGKGEVALRPSGAAEREDEHGPASVGGEAGSQDRGG